MRVEIKSFRSFGQLLLLVVLLAGCFAAFSATGFSGSRLGSAQAMEIEGLQKFKHQKEWKAPESRKEQQEMLQYLLQERHNKLRNKTKEGFSAHYSHDKNRLNALDVKCVGACELLFEWRAKDTDGDVSGLEDLSGKEGKTFYESRLDNVWVSDPSSSSGAFKFGEFEAGGFLAKEFENDENLDEGNTLLKEIWDAMEEVELGQRDVPKVENVKKTQVSLRDRCKGFCTKSSPKKSFCSSSSCKSKKGSGSLVSSGGSGDSIGELDGKKPVKPKFYAKDRSWKERKQQFSEYNQTVTQKKLDAYKDKLRGTKSLHSRQRVDTRWRDADKKRSNWRNLNVIAKGKPFSPRKEDYTDDQNSFRRGEYVRAQFGVVGTRAGNFFKKYFGGYLGQAGADVLRPLVTRDFTVDHEGEVSVLSGGKKLWKKTFWSAVGMFAAVFGANDLAHRIDNKVEGGQFAADDSHPFTKSFTDKDNWAKWFWMDRIAPSEFYATPTFDSETPVTVSNVGGASSVTTELPTEIGRKPVRPQDYQYQFVFTPSTSVPSPRTVVQPVQVPAGQVTTDKAPLLGAPLSEDGKHFVLTGSVVAKDGALKRSTCTADGVCDYTTYTVKAVLLDKEGNPVTDGQAQIESASVEYIVPPAPMAASVSYQDVGVTSATLVGQALFFGTGATRKEWTGVENGLKCWFTVVTLDASNNAIVDADTGQPVLPTESRVEGVQCPTSGSLTDAVTQPLNTLYENTSYLVRFHEQLGLDKMDSDPVLLRTQSARKAVIALFAAGKAESKSATEANLNGSVQLNDEKSVTVRFEVFGSDGKFFTSVDRFVDKSGDVSVPVNGLTPGAHYTFRLTAVDHDSSDLVGFDTPPSVPVAPGGISDQDESLPSLVDPIAPIFTVAVVTPVASAQLVRSSVKLADKSVTVQLSCQSANGCAGWLALQAKVSAKSSKKKGNKRGSKTSQLIALLSAAKKGSFARISNAAKFKLTNGQKTSVTVRLNGLGIKLTKTGRRLVSRVAFMDATAGSVLSTEPLTIITPKTSTKRK